MCITENQKALLGDTKKCDAILQLDKLRASIPKEAFVKSLSLSSFYMIFDYSMWVGSLLGILYLHEKGIFATLPDWQQYAATLAFWNISGFFMWCIFVVGHDCGHGTFSEYTLLNDIIGHVTHGSILVPYYSWRLSHRRHHMFHNHIDKDYSHPWYTPDKLQKPDEHLARMMEQYPFIRFFFPIVGWPLYLYGMPDGSHWIPFSNQRMWKDTEVAEYRNCIISTLVVVANIAAIYYMCSLSGDLIMNALYYYVAPWFVFSWWLVTVTYLQHHNHDTLVYDEHDWKFVEAAFETVDRKFGYGIDTLHHHITDGHVAHHLFFTKIPHYNLMIATNAIVNYLKENKLDFKYKSDITYDFPYRVHKYMVQYGLAAKRASEAPTVAVPESIKAKKSK